MNLNPPIIRYSQSDTFTVSDEKNINNTLNLISYEG